MIIPVGLIVQLLDKMLTRGNQNAGAHPDERLYQIAMMRTAAMRLGVEVQDYGQRFVMVSGQNRVEVKFLAASRGTEKMTWAISGPPPGFPVFKIVKHGTMSFARKKAPRGSVPQLDHYYDVQTNDPESVSVLWAEDLCQWLARMSSEPTVTSDGQLLEICCASSGHPDVLDTGVKLCFALARGDVFSAKLLKDLPNVEYVQQQLPMARVRGPGEIRIGYVRENDIVMTRAYAAVAELSEAVANRARQLGATPSISGGELVLSWPNVIRDKQRLLEVIALLRDAASPSQGVFR